jgi:transcriptional regulator with XRE-family HTH domain
MTSDELRAIRAALGWSQTTAAQRLGIKMRSYKYYEAGARSSGAHPAQVPQAIALAMLAHKFNRDIAALFPETEDPGSGSPG